MLQDHLVPRWASSTTYSFYETSTLLMSHKPAMLMIPSGICYCLDAALLSLCPSVSLPAVLSSGTLWYPRPHRAPGTYWWPWDHAAGGAEGWGGGQGRSWTTRFRGSRRTSRSYRTERCFGTERKPGEYHIQHPHRPKVDRASSVGFMKYRNTFLVICLNDLTRR